MKAPPTSLTPIYIPQIGTVRYPGALTPVSQFDFRLEQHNMDMSIPRNPHNLVESGIDSSAQPLPDLARYNSASPFSPNAHSDLLLTPTSSVASPAIQHKNPGPYGSPQQAVVHPNASIYYPFESSQVSSPVSMQMPPATESHFDMNYLHSPATEPPFFGNFGVSAGPEPVDREPHHQRYFMTNPPLMNGLHVSTDRLYPEQRQLSSMEHTPVISPLHAERMHVPTQYCPILGSASPEAQEPPSAARRRSSAQNPRAAATRQRKASTRRRAAAPRDAPVSPVADMPLPQDESRTEVKRVARPTLNLRDDAPAEAKHVLELRKKFFDDKGKGMWVVIVDQYESKYGSISREALQMKLSRAVQEYAHWPESEVQRLIDATRAVDSKRNEMIAEYMNKDGGGQVWQWKAKNIEAQMIKLGLEDANINEKDRSQRKRMTAKRKRLIASGAMPVVDSDPNGLGQRVRWTLPPHHPEMAGQQQHQQQHPMLASHHPQETYGRQPSGVIEQHTYSWESEAEVLDNLDRKYGHDFEDCSPAYTEDCGMVSPGHKIKHEY